MNTTTRANEIKLKKKEKKPVPDGPPKETGLAPLDEKAIEAAKKNLSEGAITPSYPSYREEIIQMLNDSLATELICVLRYRRHYFTAKGISSPKIAEEFLVHATAELAHSDRIAERIVQLGGEPDYAPDSLTARSHADYDESTEIQAMIKANLASERVAIETYRQMIERIGEHDSTTRRILEDILMDEEEHADELSDWLE